MDAVKEIWNKFKGTIAFTLLTTLVGFTGVLAFVGLEVVEGPKDAVCVAVKAETVEVVVE